MFEFIAKNPEIQRQAYKTLKKLSQKTEELRKMIGESHE